MEALDKLIRGIDKVNAWVGNIFCWLILPMTFISGYEVVARYVFNAPTKWAWAINSQLLGAMVVLLGGYALLNRSHVIVDVLVNRLSIRRRAILDLFLSTIFFFVFSIAAWQWIAAAWNSVLLSERSDTAIHAPVYQLKVIIAIGIILLLLQGMAEFGRNLRVVILSKTAAAKTGGPIPGVIEGGVVRE